MQKTWIETHVWRPQFYKRPMLIVTFDDGRPSDYEAATDQRGITGTSYVNTSVVDTDDFLTWSEIKEMLKRGWDVQCHAHEHLYLTTLTEEALRQQFILSDEAFSFQGLAKPIHHANPYGDTNVAARAIISDYRTTQRAGAGGVLTFDEIDFQRITAMPADMQTVIHYNNILNAVRSAFAENKILVIYLHRLEDTPTNPYRCVKEYFWGVMDYALDLGMPIWSIDAMYNYVSYYNTLQ